MKVLITGTNGFIGRNLMFSLREVVMPFDREHSLDYLEGCIKRADFIFHLASEIKGNFENNTDLTRFIVNNASAPIVFTSTTQEGTNYSNSKKESEDILSAYKGAAYIYRLSNVFGRWARPNHNSAVATFIFNVQSGKELWINEPSKVLRLIYIDDLIEEFKNVMYGAEPQLEDFQPSYDITVGRLAEVIQTFSIDKELHMKLFETYHEDTYYHRHSS